VLKRGLRLCLFVLMIGLSFLVVAAVRINSVPRFMSFGNEDEGATSGWVLYPDFLMFDRDFSVTIRANNTVSVYILDATTIRQWNVNKTVDAVWAYENVVDGVFSEHPEGRGGYAVLVYLPEDSVTSVKVILTFSGFEKDLLTFSVGIVAVGALSLVVLLSTNLRNKSHKARFHWFFVKTGG